MSLTPGTRLGPYEILAAIGAGGMGEVYRARDAKLNRDVALKVLSNAFITDAERLARFRREAQVLASLNHPNIAAIYGFEDSGATHALVLELVEGPTLADRIAQGSIAPADALPIARQIAEALEAAHEQGIIHRDLKPANVKVRDDGTVKVLDFGLAKAMRAETSGGSTQTMTSPAMTEIGIILGTAAYMSPEQAKGKATDRRADIWALGVVLFEMLAGRGLYRGETVTETIAHAITQPVPWEALPASTPQAVRRLLRRMLEKDPRRRLQSAGDVRIEIDEMLNAPAEDSATMTSAGTSSKRFGLGAVLVILATLAGVVIGTFVSSNSSTADGAALRLSITTPPNLRVRNFKLTPDGTRLVIRASPSDGKTDPASERQLYVRTLDAYDFKPIAGTERTLNFALSTDNRWVAVLVRPAQDESDRRLVKIPIDGSTPPVLLTHWADTWSESFTWLANGDLLLAATEDGRQSALRIPTGGGSPSKPVPLQHDSKYLFGGFGQELPGGKVIVHMDGFSGRGYQTNIWLLDPSTGALASLIENAGHAKYLGDGRLVFSREGTLMAVPFDPQRGATTGEISALTTGLRTPAGPAAFELANNGTLAFVPSSDLSRRLILIGAGGHVSPFVSQPARFTLWPSLSRDGQRAAVTVITQTGTYEAWVADSSRQSLRRLLVPQNADISGAMWLADDLQLAYAREGLSKDDGIYVQRADGQGRPGRIAVFKQDEFVGPTDYVPNQSGLIAVRFEAGKADVVFVPMPVNGQLQPVRTLRGTSANESSGVVSADGRLLAYLSDESGRPEVYVAPFEKGVVGTPVVVSDGVSDGACGRAEWSAVGHRLYFCARPGRLVAVDVKSPPALTAGKPVEVADLIALRVSASEWTVRADGKIVAIQRSEAEETVASINVVINWYEELRRRAGASR